VVLRHDEEHALESVMDDLLDVVPVVHLALDDWPEGFEMLEAVDDLVADQEVLEVRVDAVAVGDD